MKQILLSIAISFISALSFAQNLVPNGNFDSWEDANTPSSFVKAESVEQESVIVQSGTYSVKQTGGTKKLAINVPVVEGKTYRISMWYYVDTETGDGSDARIWSYWKSGSSSVDDHSDELKGPNNGYFESKAEWSQYEVELTAPATVDGLYLELRTYSGAVAYYDNLEVEEVVSTTTMAPVFSMQNEYFSESFDLELTSGTEEASIYYTVDGSEPNESSMLYSSSIYIDESVPIKAIAIANGLDDSNVVTQEYTKYNAYEGNFTKITSVSDLKEGYYLLGYEGNFMLNEVSGSYLNKFTETDEVDANSIERPNIGVVWSLIKVGENWLIYNESTMKYISYTGDENTASLVDVAGDSEEWSISGDEGVFIIKNVAIVAKDRYLQYNNGSPRFACYTGSQRDLELYRIEGATRVGSPASSSYSVYPNPFANELTITSNETIANVEIMNAVGQLVNKVIVSDDKAVLNTSSLNPGIYLVKVNYSNGSTKVHKVVKH